MNALIFCDGHLRRLRRAAHRDSLSRCWSRLAGAGGGSDALPDNPPDERGNSPILPWRNIDELAGQLRVLGLLHR
ncbi:MULTISPECIES: hypothetical protein [Stenotrophomonas maltophilia group]|uniref:hypothetical protein n=1 Tax=Stenotrophomonas maltophilia group TaxID=995085 RepID=UPI001E3573A9|nr:MULTISPECIES: hypothetical protein [Stenotrophomonas maltophilia group]MDQ4681471.1 hypothetical protein [Stenotrophomonas maltophilia group sp. RNC7]UGB21221.1 hypothetical protein LQ335_18555 [Stenotrophomonas maltophilia]